MINITQTDVLVVIASFVLTLFIRLVSKQQSKHPYPPGPRRLPILGNLHQFPKSPEWVTYDKWSKEFGSDLIYIRGAGMEFVILSSYESMVDLLDKRSSIYSSRPEFPMAGDLMGWDWLIAALAYGDEWRERRRAFTKYFHPSDPSAYQPNQIEFVHGMLSRLLEDPDDFFAILKHTVGGSSISMTYGLPIKKKDDPYVLLANKAIATLNETVLPANYLVNIVPALKCLPEYFPGAGFKKLAREYKELQERFLNVPFADAVKILTNGDCKPCFTASSLGSIADLTKTEHTHHLKVIREAAGQVFQASADTTLSGLQSLIGVMLLFPEAQRKAQMELDRVLGGRLPDFSDEPDLPYLTAVVMELLRWNPMAPLALPHKCTQDDIYKGYFIPKGAILMPNLWALMYDEEHFPNPTVFNPDRFMRDGKLCLDGLPDPREIVFGFGRRICPGRHIGISFMWLAAASILSVFNITKAKDENGQDIEARMKPMYGVVIEWEPFKCAITPRSKEAVERIHATTA